MRRAMVVVAVAVAVSVVGALALRQSAPGDAQADTGSDGITTEQAASTTTVEARDLIEYAEFTGSLGYGTPVAVSAGNEGTVTDTPSRGDVIGDGDTLFEIDTEPVVLITGTTPMYRALDTGVGAGPDVAQLEAFLLRAGHAEGLDLTVDEEFTSVTAAAVEAWEEALGRSDADGEVGMGDIVFSSDEVRVDSISAVVGARVSSGTAVLDVTGTARSATVDLDTDDVDQLPLGATVELELPDGTPSTGTVAAVGVDAEQQEATEEEEEASDPTVPVQIVLDDPSATDVDTGAVVIRTVASSEEAATAVDVTALLALAEGGYALEVVDGAATTLVAVELGTFADGYVAVSGPGIEPGVEVVVPA